MILVTGATGILGRVLVLELLKKGKNVKAVKRKNSNLQEVRNSYRYYTDKSDEWFNKIEWVEIDFQDIHSLQKALVDVQEVYHCAAKVSFYPKESEEMFRVNIEATQNLLYACENSSVEKFCYVSSIAVLDGLNEEGKTDESSDFNSKLAHSNYAISKHFAEMEVWRASAEGLKTVIVNPGVILGSGNWSQSSGELFSKLIKHNYTFSGGTAYIDVRDVAKISLALMDSGKFDERYILVSENISYLEIANKVRQKIGLKPVKVLPKIILNAAAFLNVLLGWLIPVFRLANKANINALTTFNTISNSKIKSTLDYTFTPIDESINFHLNNYQEDVLKTK